MKSIASKFRIKGKEEFSLSNFDPGYSAGYKKEEAEAELEKLIRKTADAETELYASKRYALLIIFQAMDAAGKDSAIKHTMSGLNPQGCEVYSFKQPGAEEYAHDFLWRHYKTLPERGRIGIFNRSHYENVLITKIHPELLEKEDLPKPLSLEKLDKDFWKYRYESIRDFEKHLYRNGTVIIKFFLHVSKQEQKERFIERINDASKNWKFSVSDIEERKYWDQYMDAYQQAISETASPEIPWYIIPADKKWFSRIAISTIILDTLKSLKLKYPVLQGAQLEELKKAKRQLEDE